MKRKISVRTAFAVALSCYVLLGSVACVNKIGDDSEENVKVGNIPISFSFKRIKNPTSKMTDGTFEQGDQMGLFACVPSSSLKGRRYIENVMLEYTDNATLIPKKAVFYPEGGIPLNFISYYPYRFEGIPAGSSLLPVSVQVDQSDKESRAQSDFMVAKAKDITSQTKTVALEFKHQFTKLTITLAPGPGVLLEDMKKSNPRIIVTGFKTAANYDLEAETFHDMKDEHGIVAAGEWKMDSKKGTLSGKEFIIIPQTVDPTRQSIVMEWDGNIYSCAMPAINMESNTQCAIGITATSKDGNELSCFTGEIQQWGNAESGVTDNTGTINAVHIAAFSFNASNAYRIYHEGMPVAEVWREYLVSDQLTSRAITVYPVLKDETTDLSNGIVLQLADRKDIVCGGRLSWHTDGKGFTYTEGDMTEVDRFYIDESCHIRLEKPVRPIDVTISCYTLRDVRNGKITHYPISKIGTQYWMGGALTATAYRDGTSLTKQQSLGKENPGYFQPEGKNIYFYNGEAMMKGDLAPDGWKIPSNEDWKQLQEYIKDDVSMLKSGEWQALNTNSPVASVNNYTHFNAFPLGIWIGNAHFKPYKLTAFWSWDQEKDAPSNKVFYLLGDQNNFIESSAFASDENERPTDYYKALSIRCIKE